MDGVNGAPTLGSIQFLTGSLAGSTFPITKPTTIIGRDSNSDIVISDQTVSRQHAKISWNNGAWSIEKLNPRNTMTVNQQEVQQVPLKDRDTIGLGPGTTFLLLIDASVSGVPSVPKVEPSQSIIGGPFATAQPSNPYNPTVAVPPPVQQGAPYLPTEPISPPGPASRPYNPAVQQSAPYLPTQGVPPPGQQGRPQPYLGTERMSAPVAGSTYIGNRGGSGVPSLEVSSNVHHEKRKYDLTKQEINIGRDPQNDIVINENVVSGFHAQIKREGNQVILIHPHPSRQETLNGILYKGHHIAGTEQFHQPLVRGDVFRIGDEHGTLVTLTFDDGSGTPQEHVPEIHPIALGAPEITLGRATDNNVVLNHPQVSNYHARLELVNGTYRIVDLGSTNKVYVNAKRVKEHTLKPGDEIRIGPFKLIYTGTELTQHDERNSIRIDAVNLKKVGDKQKVLINNISVVIPPRKFIALVGGSGAGKSTLLDALNGLRPAQQGVVLYNGKDYYRHLAAFSTQLGYVPQDDIIHRDLTVERALYYAAKLRLPSDFTSAQIRERIDEVLEDVDMKNRRKLLISKLSGGQRKRVSIALELLANPSVFFLDEPTSGLDPGLDRKMMYLMRNLADKGHTIVLVTHATNNINSADYVCFLAQGGHLAYFGPPNEAKIYFDKTDFAEIYSSLEPTEERPNIPTEAEEAFKKSPYYQKYVVEPLSQGPAGRISVNPSQETAEVDQPKRGKPWKQFFWLSMRYLDLLKNDRVNLAILILQAPLIGIILMFMLLAPPGKNTFALGAIVSCPSQTITGVPPQLTQFGGDCSRLIGLLQTPQGQQFVATQKMPDGTPETADGLLNKSITPNSGIDAEKILFIMAFAAVMFGCVNGAREIVKEVPVYKRERSVNLGIIPYLFSKIVVLGVFCLIQSAVLVLLVNIAAPFVHSTFLPPFFEIYITLALTSLAGLMIGLLVSAVAPNNDRAVSLIPLILIPQVIFSGIIFTLNGPVLQILGAFFAARWAIAGMGSTVGLHGKALASDDFSYQGNLYSSVDQHAATTNAIIHLGVVWFALVVMIVVFGLATAYFLKKKDVRR